MHSTQHNSCVLPNTDVLSIENSSSYKSKGYMKLAGVGCRKIRRYHPNKRVSPYLTKEWHRLSSGRLESKTLTGMTITNDLFLLKKSEGLKINRAVSTYKAFKYKYSCNSNVLEILKSLPIEMLGKLKVVIATHERNGIMTYYNICYSIHVFILAKTYNGIMIFDPQVPSGTSMKSDLWFEKVYDKESIQYALTNDYTLQFLPQFRILDAITFIKCYKDLLEIGTSSPEYALQEHSDITTSELWEKSFSVNLYELYQFFSEKSSYEDTISHHEVRISPLTRLKSEHIEFIKKFFEST